MKAALGLGLPILGGGGWTPVGLGAALLAWWDAERAETVAQSGGAVNSWTDLVGGYAATQLASGAKPVWDATSFGGRAAITFDGSDDELSLAGLPGSFPVGSAGCEMFALAANTALPADTTARRIFTYGGASQPFARQLNRSVSSGVNRVNVIVGDGSSQASAVTTSATPFDGAHVAHAVIEPTQATAFIDGVAGGAANPAAIVPGTTAVRARIGATTNSSASSFWQGAINTVILTGPLAADQRGQLVNYLKARGGLA